jgi:hypothetical protein
MIDYLPILVNSKQSDLTLFIEFWSKLYSYPLENLYNETIIKEQYEIDDMQRLFIWKNGMKLSSKKQQSLDLKIKPKLTLINKLKQNDDWSIDDFQSEFGDLSAVWKIFLLHIIKPKVYPIYDQHINRTYNYIHRLPYTEISANMSNKNKEYFYFNTYLNFIKEQSDLNLKKFDEAFFAFGKFINTNNNIILFQQ